MSVPPPENGGAHPHPGGAFFDGHFKIVRHAHGQFIQGNIFDIHFLHPVPQLP